MLKLFAVSSHPACKPDEPVYVIRDGGFFRTVYHPAGWSGCSGLWPIKSFVSRDFLKTASF
jgi:hypothetical protein